MQIWMVVISFFATASASAGSLRVADVIQIEAGTLAEAAGEKPAATPVPGPAISAEAPDVINDPDAGTEVISHLPPRFTSHSTDETVTLWTRRADSILERARAKNDADWNPVFKGVRRALGRATIKWPRPGMDLRGCKDRVLAFVIPFVPTIHLCAGAVYGVYGEKGMAQILIHESAHVARHFDECDATRIEVNAMRMADEGIAFRNGYWQRCGMN